MNGRGMMGYAGEADDGTLLEAVSPEVHDWLGDRRLFLLFVAGPAFHFFPLLLLLIWALPFLVAPALVVVTRVCGALWSPVRGRVGRRQRRARSGSFWRLSRGMGSSRRRWRRWRLRHRLPRRTGCSPILPTAVTWR